MSCLRVHRYSQSRVRSPPKADTDRSWFSDKYADALLVANSDWVFAERQRLLGLNKLPTPRQPWQDIAMSSPQISFQHPGLKNPREAAQPQEDGSFKRVLLVDCAIDLSGSVDPSSPLSEVIDEALEVAAIHGFDSVTFCGSGVTIETKKAAPTLEGGDGQ